MQTAEACQHSKQPYASQESTWIKPDSLHLGRLSTTVPPSVRCGRCMYQLVQSWPIRIKRWKNAFFHSAQPKQLPCTFSRWCMREAWVPWLPPVSQVSHIFTVSGSEKFRISSFSSARKKYMATTLELDFKYRIGSKI